MSIFFDNNNSIIFSESSFSLIFFNIIVKTSIISVGLYFTCCFSSDCGFFDCLNKFVILMSINFLHSCNPFSLLIIIHFFFALVIAVYNIFLFSNFVYISECNIIITVSYPFPCALCIVIAYAKSNLFSCISFSFSLFGFLYLTILKFFSFFDPYFVSLL
ncbi:hypothetical protein [Acanthamoeba polyphaga mimivirus]|uniref:Uncharacterized protein n=1 Tax=Acanthamoeba polyphaga mimivirus TaxID=212035 RepID=A0A2L2DKY3_MIMIV|nr:hypothetical protein [Acanthamoeba polyphaga mimivirus]